VGAQGRFLDVFGGHHLMDGGGVAIETGVLRYAAISGLNMNWFMEILQRERQGMEKAIVGLRNQFAEFVVGQMAVVTNGDMPVARVLPGIVMSLHHMAIRAGFWFAAQVACALAVAEREQADAEKQA
jgi:hypothetical protein